MAVPAIDNFHVPSTAKLVNKKKRHVETAFQVTQSVLAEVAVKTEEPEAKKKKIELLKPSDEAWTEVALKISWPMKLAYNTLVYPLLSLVIQKKLKPEIWNKIATFNLDSLKKVGDIEKFALSIIESAMTQNQEKRIEVHTKLQKALQVFSVNQSVKEAYPHLKELISTK